MSKTRAQKRRLPTAPATADLRETIREFGNTNELLLERVAELELQIDDLGWVRLGMHERDLGLEDRRRINGLVRWMWRRNPLIRRGVSVQADYVFAQGVNIHARAAAVDEVVQAFLDDPRNRAELTGHQARMQKEPELTLFGNLYLVLFTNFSSGRVRVRTLPVDEVTEIVTNPEDAKEPWFYRREWDQVEVDGRLSRRIALYPDFRHQPRAKPATIGDAPVEWESPVYHVKVGCLSDEKFGLSEVYAAIDWARAYKEFLEDWATLSRAYSRWAHKVTTPSKAAAAATKTRLATTLGTQSYDTNPPPVTGSTAVLGPGMNLDPIRIGGANISSEDGRRLFLMVAAAVGLPESFFGDVSVGTLATAKSLDRPTELKMLARQVLWSDVYREVLTFVIIQAIERPNGPLRGVGQVLRDEDGNARIELEPIVDEETGEEVAQDPTIDVDWPSLIEHDVQARIQAIVSAATLSGGTPSAIPDMRVVARMLLTALGEDDVDELLDNMFPEDEQADDEEEPDPDEEPEPEPGESEDEPEPAPVDDMTEAVRELREAVAGFVERYRAVPA